MTTRIALAGCGTVGRAFVRLLRETQRDVEIVRVLVRDPCIDRGVPIATDRFTTDPAEFAHTRADVVVELLGGVEPANTIVRTALGAGRAVVTANKALLARHGAELSGLAARHGTTLAFEGAVGGGVPMVRTLRDGLAGVGVRTITGVLNGTSNFILTRLGDGDSLAQALEEARRRGFAEADASRDLDGRDAADKIALLAWLAFGVDPATIPIAREGIPADAEGAVARARERGGVLRLVAGAYRDGRGVRAWVKPLIVPLTSALARARDEENVVEVESASSGVITLAGRGAGGDPTAAAVLADVLAA
ncbi:MAG: homoserine dehydrogenase [Gemmatimonadaceae bacterium]|nr:homoserine dehydrogenase [Gemmatimonadaceae bacterium]